MACETQNCRIRRRRYEVLMKSPILIHNRTLATINCYAACICTWCRKHAKPLKLCVSLQRSAEVQRDTATAVPRKDSESVLQHDCYGRSLRCDVTRRCHVNVLSLPFWCFVVCVSRASGRLLCMFAIGGYLGSRADRCERTRGTKRSSVPDFPYLRISLERGDLKVSRGC